MTQKFIIAACASMLALSSCGIFHRTQSSSHVTKSDSTSKSIVHEQLVDTGTITSTEVTEYSFSSPGLSFSKRFPMSSVDLIKKLSNGFVTLDSAMVGVKVGYDTLSKNLVIQVEKKPEAVKAKHTKFTTEKKGLSKQKQAVQAVTVKKQKVDKQTDKKPDYSWIWWLVSIIGVLGLLLYISYKLKPKWL